MPARRHLLARGPLTAALSLLLLAAFGSAASGEIPQTTAEWLALFNHRRNNTYSVRLECTWQTLVNGRLEEEWDQVVQLDDFGGTRIEELGRIRHAEPPSTERSLIDAIYAFDGSEYREFVESWRIEGEGPLDRERKDGIRRSSPSSKGGWVEAEPGELAKINRLLTPLKLADYWFAACLTGASREGIEPRIHPVDGRPGVWEVALESANETLGHKCKAIVNEARDARVERIVLWHEGAWVQTCVADYEQVDGRWRIVTGALITRSPLRPDGQVREDGQRVTVRESEFSGPSAGEVVTLPEFPAGTALTDHRSGATYRVGADATVEEAIAELAVEGQQKLAELETRRSDYYRWPTQLRLAVQSAVLGAVVGLIALRLASALRWVRQRHQDHQRAAIPEHAQSAAP